MATDDMNHLRHLSAIAEGDVSVLLDKEATYQGSWKRAGGRSAWFMMRRNMDRLITMMARVEFLVDPERIPLAPGDEITLDHHEFKQLLKSMRSEDIFAMIQASPLGEDGTVLACLRDLRRYAVLLESEMVAEGHVAVEYGPSYLRDKAEGNVWSAGGWTVSNTDAKSESIPPVETLSGRILDEVLRCVCSDWSEPTRATAVSHALTDMAGHHVYGQAAFVSGLRDTEIESHHIRSSLRGTRPHPGSRDPIPRDLYNNLLEAVRYATNVTGLDARLDTPDHTLAVILTQHLVNHLEGRTGGQMLESGWTVSTDGEGTGIPPKGWAGFPKVAFRLDFGQGASTKTDSTSNRVEEVYLHGLELASAATDDSWKGQLETFNQSHERPLDLEVVLTLIKTIERTLTKRRAAPASWREALPEGRTEAEVKELIRKVYPELGERNISSLAADIVDGGPDADIYSEVAHVLCKPREVVKHAMLGALYDGGAAVRPGTPEDGGHHAGADWSTNLERLVTTVCGLLETHKLISVSTQKRWVAEGVGGTSTRTLSFSKCTRSKSVIFWVEEGVGQDLTVEALREQADGWIQSSLRGLRPTPEWEAISQ